MKNRRNARQMKTRRTASVVIAAGASIMLVACGGNGDSASAENASGDEIESNVAVATHPVGSSYHSVGTAVASLISTHTDKRASVQPYSGPNAWIPALQTGDVAFGIASSVDAIWAFTGGPGYETPAEEVRLVVNGAPNPVVSMITLESSDIETSADLAGHRVVSGYGGNTFAAAHQTAHLASVGLTWDDVEAAPAPDTSLAIEALRSGQADAAFGLTATSPTAVDLNAANPVRALPWGDLEPEDLPGGETPDEMQAILDEHIPGTRLDVLPGGEGYLKEDTVGFTFDIQLISNKAVSSATVRDVVEGIWNNYEELHDSHPTGQWEPESMVPEDFSVPYHEGAVEFFESEGVWTDAHQQQQEALLD